MIPTGTDTPKQPVPVGARTLVGRDVELARLAGLAACARSGRAVVLWIRGESGVGKTALLRAFAAAQPGLRFLTAVADAAEEPVERGVVAQVVSQAGICLPVAASTGKLVALLRGVCTGGPSVLVVDNVERLDSGSAAVLERALPGLDGTLVVLVAGPLRDPEPLTVTRLARVLPGALVLHLDGLSLASVARLGPAVCGREIDSATIRWLHRCTRGNPLHARTVLGKLPVPSEPGRAPLPASGSLAAPVRDTIAMLPGPARAVLEALAVLGGAARFAAVARLAEVADLERALRPTRDAGLTRLDRDHVAPVVRFVRDADRDAVYSTLSPARRRALHGRAAPLVTPDAAWEHRVATSAGDEELARELTDVALDRAADGRHARAARYLHWAADVSERRAHRERRLQLALVHASLARTDPEAGVVRALVERTAPSPLRALALGLSELLHHGDGSAAERWLHAALVAPECADRWVPRAAAAGLAGLGARRVRSQQTTAARLFALDHGRLPERIVDCTRALAAVARAQHDGPRRGLECLRHLPDDPHLVPSTQLDTLAQRGALHLLTGRLADAAADLDVVLAQRRPDVHLLAATDPWSYRGILHYLVGNWDEAEDAVRHAFADGSDDDSSHVRVLRHMCSALAPAGRGEFVVAERHVQEARRIAVTLGGPQDRHCAALADAVRFRALGDPAGMAGALQALHGELDLDGPAAWWAQWWRPLLVEGLIGTGALETAAAHLAVLRLDAAGAEHLDCAVVRLSAAHAAAAGDLAGALRTASEYLDRPAHPDTPEPPLERAALEHDHARRLLQVHQRTAATAFLRTARNRYAALGAAPYERRVVLDLDRHPARAGLTGREEQVACLAALGHSNREIGRRLRIATKTVEYHLRNVFAKLVISSRAELRSVVRAPEVDPRASRSNCVMPQSNSPARTPARNADHSVAV